MGLLLLIVVIVLLMGGLPHWGYHSYGYGPSGLVGVVGLVLVVLLFTGRLWRGQTGPGRQGSGARVTPRSCSRETHKEKAARVAEQVQEEVARAVAKVKNAWQAQDLLAVVLQALQEQPTLQMHIAGHADSAGSDAYNIRLSQRRAASVAHSLAAQGVRKGSIAADWRSERGLAASNATAEGRAQNRQVEITLSPPAQ